MKIAFLNPQGNFDPADSYWTEHPDFGGQLVYVKETALAMAALGHHVDILTRLIVDPDWSEFSERIARYPGVDNLHIVRLPAGSQQFLPKEQLWPHVGTDWVPNIIDFYHREDLPHIFTAHYGDGGLAGALLKGLTGVPFTFTGHSLGAQKMDKLNLTPENLAQMENRFSFTRRIAAERLSMDRAARIVTSTRQEQREQYGHHIYKNAIDPAEEGRFTVIPPGVNRKVFSPDPEVLDKVIDQRIDNALTAQIPEERRHLPVVLAASRLDAKKNHLGVIRAFAQSEELHKAANFALVVRGLHDPLHDYQSLSPSEKSVMDEIVEAMDRQELWNAVFAFSLDSQAELAAGYRCLVARQSLFILPALYEPFGLAPLEAMSCGLPVVVTQNGGPLESMREAGQEFGVLVDPANPTEIAKGILRLLESKREWKAFHQAGIKRVNEKYTWERTAEGYLKVFESILKGNDFSKNTLPIPAFFTNPKIDDLPIASLSELYFRDV